MIFARRLAPLASLACIALVSTGCVAAGSSAAGSPTSTPAASAGAASDAATSQPTGHVDADPLSLEIPAGWHARRGLANPSGVFAIVYLSPAPIPSDCQATIDGGGVCHSWPLFQLDPGGLVARVMLHGMPRLQPPAGGTPITVAGMPARRISGSADEACRAIGGSQSITIVLPSVPDTYAWMSIDACVAGGDPMGAEQAAADDTFDAIVASATLAPAAPSPSEGIAGPLPD
jgi:hypothetical protein